MRFSAVLLVFAIQINVSAQVPKGCTVVAANPVDFGTGPPNSYPIPGRTMERRPGGVLLNCTETNEKESSKGGVTTYFESSGLFGRAEWFNSRTDVDISETISINGDLTPPEKGAVTAVIDLEPLKLRGKKIGKKDLNEWRAKVVSRLVVIEFSAPVVLDVAHPERDSKTMRRDDLANQPAYLAKFEAESGELTFLDGVMRFTFSNPIPANTGEKVSIAKVVTSFQLTFIRNGERYVIPEFLVEARPGVLVMKRR